MADADNQQGRLYGLKSMQDYYFELKRLPRKYLYHFLAGFVDGEGSFNVSFSRIPSLRSGWIINTKFQVYQHEKHPEIMEIFREVFQTGRIRKKAGSNVLVYSVDSRKSQAEKIIPFFSRYPLATKRYAFQQWKRIVEMINQKEHLTADGFRTIVDIAHAMNAQGKGRKWEKSHLLQSSFRTEPSETTRRAPD